MHKLLILLAACSLSVGVASAQSTVKKAKFKTEAAKSKHTPKTPEQQADHFAQRLTQKLALSTDQSQRVRQLNLAYRQEEQALKAKYGTERKNPAKHQELKAARARFETQLTQVLRADQAAKYAQLHEEKMQKHGKSKEKLKARS